MVVACRYIDYATELSQGLLQNKEPKLCDLVKNPFPSVNLLYIMPVFTIFSAMCTISKVGGGGLGSASSKFSTN